MELNHNKDCHSFNVQMAKEIGLVETLILKHLYYWCYANSDNQDMIKNGYIWVYITRKKIEETYPYLKDGKIRGAIEKLKKDGYILINCFNKLAIDKTNWYALTDKAYKEFGTSLAKLTNGKLKSPSDSQNNQAIQSIEKEYNNKERIYKKETSTIVEEKKVKLSFADNKIALEKRSKTFGENLVPYIETYGKEMIRTQISFAKMEKANINRGV